MKVRTVSVFYGPGRSSAWVFDMVVPDYSPADFDPTRVLGALAPHPEDREAEPEPDSPHAVMREYVRQLAPLVDRMTGVQLSRVPLGTRWHDGCVECETPAGDLVLIPLAAVARITLGPIHELTPAPSEASQR